MTKLRPDAAAAGGHAGGPRRARASVERQAVPPFLSLGWLALGVPGGTCTAARQWEASSLGQCSALSERDIHERCLCDIHERC